MEKLKHIGLALSGASGAIYGWQLLNHLLLKNIRISLIISPNAKLILKDECGIDLPLSIPQARQGILEKINPFNKENFQLYDENDWNAPIASGSNAPDAFVICPTSMGTVAHIAQGLAENLTHRAADVVLKMRRPLLIVPREMPFSTLHLENLLKLSQYGATIFPASPAFYHHPQNIDDLINFVVLRLMDFLNLSPKMERWGEDLFLK